MHTSNTSKYLANDSKLSNNLFKLNVETKFFLCESLYYIGWSFVWLWLSDWEFAVSTSFEVKILRFYMLFVLNALSSTNIDLKYFKVETKEFIYECRFESATF